MHRNIRLIAAFPKSGITYLNHLIFYAVYPEMASERANMDRDYIIDMHESMDRIRDDDRPVYVKTHFKHSLDFPLLDRLSSAVCLVRDPIDVMMSSWDFKHLMGDEGLLNTQGAEAERAFQDYVERWIKTGGDEYPFAGTWLENVNSWLDQQSTPAHVVLYEDLVARPAEVLQGVLAFFDVPFDAGSVHRAVELSSVTTMRQQEEDEVASATEGTFFRSPMARGYEKGYRFVGKLHRGSIERLSPDQQARASARFAPTMQRAREASQAGGARGRPQAPSAGTQDPPGWQYVGSDWPADRRGVTGWDHPSIARTMANALPKVAAVAQSEAPLGFYPLAPEARNESGHNISMTFGYVIARAALGLTRMSVLDWGGGVGFYAVVGKALMPEVELDYTVMDRPTVAEAGRALLPGTMFSSENDECFGRTYDLVIASGALQYVDEWRTTLRLLAQSAKRWLFVTRLQIVETGGSFVVVQRAPGVGYETEYLSWVYDRQELLSAFRDCGLKVEREFLAGGHTPFVGTDQVAESVGFLLRAA